MKTLLLLPVCAMLALYGLGQTSANPIYGNPVSLTSRTNDTTTVYLKTATKAVNGIAWNAGGGKIEYRLPSDSLIVSNNALYYQTVSGYRYFVLNLSGSGGIETDPVFVSSPAYNITTPTITNWNGVYNWYNNYGWSNYTPSSFVPVARTITINGVAFNLTQNRSWTITETDPVYIANGVPKTRTITINGITNDLSINRNWTIPPSPNINVGNGFRIGVTGTNNIKTFQAGNGIAIDSTTNPNSLTISIPPGSMGSVIPPNIGSGYRIYSPQVPGFKTLMPGDNMSIDSTTNQNSLIISATDKTSIPFITVDYPGNDYSSGFGTNQGFIIVPAPGVTRASWGFNDASSASYLRPSDGDIIEIITKSAMSITLNTSNVIGDLSTVQANGFYKLVYSAEYDKWILGGTVSNGGSDYIPLSGTTTGNPVTGNIETNNGFSINSNDLEDNYIGSLGFNDGVASLNFFDNSNSSTTTISATSGEVLISSNASSSHGLSGIQDFTGNITDFDYVQKKYVDDQIAANTGVKSITGTSNQINVNNSGDAYTLSTPQNIHTGASPTFAGLTLNGNINFGSNFFAGISGNNLYFQTPLNGVGSYIFNNSAGSTQNLVVSDAGVGTFRSALTAGGIISGTSFNATGATNPYYALGATYMSRTAAGTISVGNSQGAYDGTYQAANLWLGTNAGKEAIDVRGNIVLGNQTINSDRFLGIGSNTAGTNGANSGFSGITFKSPQGSYGGALWFSTHHYGNSSDVGMVIDQDRKVGIGTLSPTNLLTVLGSNPLALYGVQATSTLSSDSILTINAGVVKKTAFTNFATTETDPLYSANGYPKNGGNLNAGAVIGIPYTSYGSNPATGYSKVGFNTDKNFYYVNDAGYYRIFKNRFPGSDSVYYPYKAVSTLADSVDIPDTAGYVMFKRTATWNSANNVFQNAWAGGAKILTTVRTLLDTVILPSAFSYITFQIRRGNEGDYRTSVDNIQDWRAAYLIPLASAKKQYYVSEQGNNANAGTTPATALRSIETAMEKTDVGTVIVLDGVYGNGQKPLGGQTGNYNLICSQNAHIGDFYAMSGWATDATYSNVQEVTNSNLSSAVAVFDRQNVDANGMFQQFSLTTSLANCAATYNSYYISGTTLYVNYPTVPGNDYNTVLVTLTGRNQFSSGSSSYNIYVEGGKWYSTLQCRSAGGTGSNPTIRMRDIQFARSSGTSYIIWDEGYDCGSYNIVAYRAGTSDGFNYHMYSSSPHLNCFEINNQVLYEYGQGASNQASTLHDTSRCLTINAKYFANGDESIADIGGSQRVILGSILSSTQGTAVLKSSDPNTKTYIENSTLEGVASYDVYADGGSAVYFRGTKFQRSFQTGGSTFNSW